MKKLVILFQMGSIVLLLSGIILAQSMGTVFTYQGKLNDGGEPANGPYDFEFKLFNAEILGSQVGQIVIMQDVGVYEGYFTVELYA